MIEAVSTGAVLSMSVVAPDSLLLDQVIGGILTVIIRGSSTLYAVQPVVGWELRLEIEMPLI